MSTLIHTFAAHGLPDILALITDIAPTTAKIRDTENYSKGSDNGAWSEQCFSVVMM